MTTLAAIGDTHMLRGQKRGRGKVSSGIVTHSAVVQRRNMMGLFVYRTHRDIIGIAIVAALTIVGDACVSEVQRRLERIGSGVANDAVLGCRQMVARRAGSDVTVVTGHAIVKYARVAENCPGKGSCTEVTVRAILIVGTGRYVINGFARTDHIVVARSAAANDTGMVIGTGGKRARGMANLAILGGRHVVARFPGRCDAMAGIAAFGQHSWVGVIDGECGSETVDVMTITTIGSGYQVCGHCGRLGGCVNTIGLIVA